MLLGSENIKQCEHCAEAFSQISLLSGSHALAKCWSDGKVRSPMCPDIPQLVKCPGCFRLIWTEDQAEVLHSDENHSIPSCLSPEAQDYAALLHKGDFGHEREYYLRTRFWWTTNDLRRYGNDPQLEYSEFEIKNLMKLDQLVSAKTDHDRLIKAEINRELERFSEAASLLEIPFSARFETRVALLNRLIGKEYPFVVRWPDNNKHTTPRYEGIHFEKYPELYRLLRYVEQDNDGITQLSDLNSRRILNDKELIIESYHNLKTWTQNRRGSDSVTLQALILRQFEQSCPWLTSSQPAGDVEFGWLIQEYICCESGDYSFGVYQLEEYDSPPPISDEGIKQGDNFIETLRHLMDAHTKDK